MMTGLGASSDIEVGRPSLSERDRAVVDRVGDGRTTQTVGNRDYLRGPMVSEILSVSKPANQARKVALIRERK